MIYISHLMMDEKMKQTVAQTGAGIESIEFSISENLDGLDKKIDEYKTRLKEIGTKELTLHGPFLDLNPMTYDSKIRDVTNLRYSQAYEAGKRLGAKKIIFHTGFLPGVYYLTDWAKRMAEFWNQFMEGKLGLQVLIENVYDKQPQPIVEVKQMVESKEFQLCLDIGHAHCYSDLPIKEWIAVYGGMAGHIHIHDNCRDRDAHMGLGRGTIEIEELLSHVKKCMPKTDFTIECNTIEDVMLSYEVLHTHIKESLAVKKAG